MSKPGGTPIAAQVAEWCLGQIGHCYVFGGAPGPDFTSCCDCSSFANYAWGRVGQQSIPDWPNGTYDGSQHGPSTLGWLADQGRTVGAIDRSEVSAGDLMVWQTHMGIAISNDQMMSAQDPANGVQQSGIDGFIPGETLTCLRMAVSGGGSISIPVPVFGSSSQIDAIVRSIAGDAIDLVGIGMQARAMGTRGWRV